MIWWIAVSLDDPLLTSTDDLECYKDYGLYPRNDLKTL